MWPHPVEVLKLDQDQTFRSKTTKKEVVKKGSGIEFLKNGAQPSLVLHTTCDTLGDAAPLNEAHGRLAAD